MKRKRVWAWAGFAVLLSLCVGMAIINGSQLWTTGLYDSYALQAFAWRQGRSSLAENIPRLELAVYQGQYYVSFPPVPTVPLWLLSFALPPARLPSGLVTLVYFLLCYPLAYALFARRLPSRDAAVLACFALAAGSCLDLAVSGSYFSGGVWYQAQMLGLLLTLLAFCGLERQEKGWHAVGLIAIALAVGCRPFQAVYVPFLLYRLFERQPGNVAQRLRRMLPYVAVPCAIGCAYGLYNLARFDSFFEFGHNYLPEFSVEGGKQFSLAHIPVNIVNILRPPFFQEGTLVFPKTFGFAVYWTSPMLLTAGCSCLRRELDGQDRALLGLAAVHFFLLLSHRTFGGWQYGTRYLCDLLPVLILLRGRSGHSAGWPERAWMGGILAFTIWGTVVFHVLSVY